MRWLITDKGDQDARRLADRHYTRVKPGSVQFCRNGQNLVFITPAADAVWVTHRPTPGVSRRMDGLDAWECALFRNEGPLLSSTLIYEAVMLTAALWGPLPADGLVTYVRIDRVRGPNPGYCFRRAGWRRVPYARRADTFLFVAPEPLDPPRWSSWSFKAGRGGKLRRDLAA